jgi:hypothetical protein
MALNFFLYCKHQLGFLWVVKGVVVVALWFTCPVVLDMVQGTFPFTMPTAFADVP